MSGKFKKKQGKIISSRHKNSKDKDRRNKHKETVMEAR